MLAVRPFLLPHRLHGDAIRHLAVAVGTELPAAAKIATTVRSLCVGGAGVSAVTP